VPSRFDAVEDGRSEHAADIHLQDVSAVVEQLVEVQDAVGDLVGFPREHHPAGFAVASPRARCTDASSDLDKACRRAVAADEERAR
jgi:hypothetical protein